MPEPVLLDMRGIVKEFPGVRALDGVDLEVREAEVHCLLGQNGAGKSTLARALSHDARLIVMDEPSAALAHDEVANLFRVIRQLTATGVAVIYISHRLEEIREIGDRVTVLKDGRTVAVGLPARTTPTATLVAH